MIAAGSSAGVGPRDASVPIFVTVQGHDEVMMKGIRSLLHITHAHGIVRRYFVTNGFDGVLAMLGMIMGFYTGGIVEIPVAISACFGAAIALAVSGFTSAYVSEAAEKRKELSDLEQALVRDLGGSVHAKAARLVPLLVAAVNGSSPFLLALVIIVPLWLAERGVPLPLPPLESCIGLAFFMAFLLGVFLGRVSGVFWLWMGVRTVLIALLTCGIILLVAP